MNTPIVVIAKPMRSSSEGSPSSSTSYTLNMTSCDRKEVRCSFSRKMGSWSLSMLWVMRGDEG